MEACNEIYVLYFCSIAHEFGSKPDKSIDVEKNCGVFEQIVLP